MFWPHREHGPWRLQFRWAEVDGRYECVGFAIEPIDLRHPEPLTATVVRTLNFGGLVRAPGAGTVRRAAGCVVGTARRGGRGEGAPICVHGTAYRSPACVPGRALQRRGVVVPGRVTRRASSDQGRRRAPVLAARRRTRANHAQSRRQVGRTGARVASARRRTRASARRAKFDRSERSEHEVRGVSQGEHRGPARPRVVAKLAARRAEQVIEPSAARSSPSSSTSASRARCRGSADLRRRGCSRRSATRDRGFDAVVIGEPQRAFYGNQFGLTFPVFTHYGVELWVPEVGGAVDPGSRRARPRHVASTAA